MKLVIGEEKVLAEGFELPIWLWELLMKESKKAKENYNRELAGAITKEYNLHHIIPDVKDWFMQELKTTRVYEKKYQEVDRMYFWDKKPTIELCDLWVNYQKKHEYNPIHNHGGVFSMVLFMSIPFTFEEEKNAPNTRLSRTQQNGCLNFHGYYDDIAVPADKTWKGKGFFFDALQYHSVYPFYTSEDYRITISGNFYLK